MILLTYKIKALALVLRKRNYERNNSTTISMSLYIMLLKDNIQRVMNSLGNQSTQSSQSLQSLQSSQINDSFPQLSLNFNNCNNNNFVDPNNTIIDQNELFDEIESQIYSFTGVGSQFNEIYSQSQITKISDVVVDNSPFVEIVESQVAIPNENHDILQNQPSTKSSIELSQNTELIKSNTDSLTLSPNNETQSFSQIGIIESQTQNSELCQSQSVYESAEPEKLGSSPPVETCGNLPVAKPPPPLIDTNKEILEIRKLLIKTNKLSTITYETLDKTIIFIFKKFDKLNREENKSKLTSKNHLSTGFLNFFHIIFKCITITNARLHEIFKITINCYSINFEKFTKRDRFQYDLVFQHIFDLIYLNSLNGKQNLDKNRESYYKRIKDHKVKNKLTISDNANNLQILLYYLIQLLFIIIGFQKNGSILSDRFFIEERLRKLLSFLILNGNTELIRVFRKSRSKLIDDT